jgi:hypothetical protein
MGNTGDTTGPSDPPMTTDPKPREHAPGHPIWTQAGPGGMHSRGCTRADCDWFEVTRPDPAADVKARHPSIEQDPIPELDP